MIPIFLSMIANKTMKYAIIIGAGIALFGVILLRIFLAGIYREKSEQHKKALSAIISRNKTDDKVEKMSIDDIRASLHKWMRK